MMDNQRGTVRDETVGSTLSPSRHNRQTNRSSTNSPQHARKFNSSHIHTVALEEQKDIEAKLLNYKITYITIAVYTSQTVLFDLSAQNYFQSEPAMRGAQIFAQFLYLPWIFKPIYGYLADWYYPCMYRVKGYSSVLAIVNMGIGLGGYLYLQSEVPSPWLLFILLLSLYSSLAFIDAVCQGMTSITSRMQNRLIEMKYGQNRQAYIVHYLVYLLARTITRPVLYLLSQLNAVNSLSSINQLQIIFLLFTLSSFLFLLFNYCYFDEFKMKISVNTRTRLCDHIRHFIDCISMDNTYLLLVFGVCISSNPALGIDYTQMAKYDSNVGSYLQRILALPILLFFFIILIFKTRKGIHNHRYFVYFGFGSMVTFLLIIMILWNFFQSEVSYYIINTLNNAVAVLCTDIVLVAEVYQVLRNGQEGYEAFLINSILGVTNIAINISNTLGAGIIRTFLDNRFYSIKAVNYCLLLCIELAIIPWLCAYIVYRRIGTRGEGKRKASEGSHGEEVQESNQLHN